MEGRNIFRIEKEHYNSIAKLLTECFLEDQLVIKQVKGIENPETFLEKLFSSQMTILHKTFEINSLDENLSSVIVGYEKKKYNQFLVILLGILCQFKLLHIVNGNDLKIYAMNCKESLKNVNLKWHREFI